MTRSAMSSACHEDRTRVHRSCSVWTRGSRGACRRRNCGACVADPTNLPVTNARHEGFETASRSWSQVISVRGSSTRRGARAGIPRSSSTGGSPCAATRRATRCSTRSSRGAGVREQRARRHCHVINGVRPGSEWRCDPYQGVESTRIVTLTPIGRRRARQKSASSKRRIRTRRGRLPLAGKIYIPE